VSIHTRNEKQLWPQCSMQLKINSVCIQVMLNIG